jgi:hypothetical protein
MRLAVGVTKVVATATYRRVSKIARMGPTMPQVMARETPGMRRPPTGAFRFPVVR